MPGMQCNIFLPHHHASAYLSSFNPSSFHNHYTTNNHNTPFQIWAFLSLFGVQIHLFLKGKEGSISSQFENLFFPLLGEISRQKNECGIWCNFTQSSASLWHPLFLLSLLEGKVKTACEEIQETYCRHFPS